MGTTSQTINFDFYLIPYAQAPKLTECKTQKIQISVLPFKMVEYR